MLTVSAIALIKTRPGVAPVFPGSGAVCAVMLGYLSVSWPRVLSWRMGAGPETFS